MSDRYSTSQVGADDGANRGVVKSDPFALANFVLNMNDEPPKRAPREFRALLNRPLTSKSDSVDLIQFTDRCEMPDKLPGVEDKSKVTSDQTVSSFHSDNSFLLNTDTAGGVSSNSLRSPVISTKLSGFLSRSHETPGGDRLSFNVNTPAGGDRYDLSTIFGRDMGNVSLRRDQLPFEDRWPHADIFFASKHVFAPCTEPWTSDMEKRLKSLPLSTWWEKAEPYQNRSVKNYWE